MTLKYEIILDNATFLDLSNEVFGESTLIDSTDNKVICNNITR